MPKPVKKRATKAKGTLPVPAKPKRPSDPMKAAQAILAEHMGRTEPEPTFHPTDDLDTRAILSAYMKVLGAKGGKVSGAKRMENLSDRQRKDIARKAAAARWEHRRSENRHSRHGSDAEPSPGKRK